MKLERLHEYVLPTVVIGLGMLLAVFVGKLSGGGNIPRLFMLFAAVAALVLLIAQNRNVWLLIPACWFLIGKVQILPIPFSVRDLTVMLVFGMTLVMLAFKLVRAKPEYGWLDLLLALNVGYLATCFARNPVGIDAFNSDLVGGKPYFDVFIGGLAYWVLMRMRVTPGAAKTLPLITVITSGTIAVFGLVTWFFPATAPILTSFYSGIDSGRYQDPANLDQGSSSQPERMSGFRDFGKWGSIAICSYFHPFTLLIPAYPFRVLGFVILGIALLLSGFRSFVMYAGAMFLMGTFFRTGFRGLLGPVLAAVFALVLLVAGQGRIYDLPLVVQRSLAFLPGDWDYYAKQSGEGSTEWRVIMWKTVLTSDEFIRNKFLGDGFGFTRRELQFISVRNFGIQTDDMSREIAMIAGDYHSGPVSSLKFVGVPGLILFYILLIAMARKAVVQIKRARNTPYFTFALFVGMPIIFEPFFFTFIFGGYNGALPTALFGAGMLKLTECSLNDYLAKPEAQSPERISPEARPHGTPQGETLTGSPRVTARP